MQVRTVRIRPARTDALNRAGVPRRDYQAELSVIGETVAFVEFSPDGKTGHIDWLQAIRPAQKQALVRLAQAYADAIVALNGKGA